MSIFGFTPEELRSGIFEEDNPPRMLFGSTWVEAVPFVKWDGATYHVRYRQLWWSFLLSENEEEPPEEFIEVLERTEDERWRQ